MTHEENFLFPDVNGFKGKVLDDHLAAGFYRIQYFMFTTHAILLEADNDPMPVFWLRTWVKKIKPTKSASAIIAKCKAFTIHFKHVTITTETEALYDLYKDHIDFSVSDSCSSYLENIFIDNPFTSCMIEIRDGDKLIAVGYFDLGENALAGILNFYHPHYKKYSLGKYLILLKINYALQNNIALYYSGYMSSAITKFDYKIFPDITAMEVFLPIEKKWLPYVSMGKEGLKEYAKRL